jgi:hypothetical protein
LIRPILCAVYDPAGLLVVMDRWKKVCKVVGRVVARKQDPNPGSPTPHMKRFMNF